MPHSGSADGAGERQGGHDGVVDIRRQDKLLEAGALQEAIFNSANFSSIATDAKGVIQIFNVGAERMLGYAAAGRRQQDPRLPTSPIRRRSSPAQRR